MLELVRGLALVNANADWFLTGREPMLLDQVTTPTPTPEPTDPHLAELVQALTRWWAQADDEERTYLRVALRRAVPEIEVLLKRGGA